MSDQIKSTYITVWKWRNKEQIFSERHYVDNPVEGVKKAYELFNSEQGFGVTANVECYHLPTKDSQPVRQWIINIE